MLSLFTWKHTFGPEHYKSLCMSVTSVEERPSGTNSKSPNNLESRRHSHLAQSSSNVMRPQDLCVKYLDCPCTPVGRSAS